jgi:hypothetical protein
LHLAFLDEFGHCGPYVARKDRRFNQSPVFGLAGYVIPHSEARNFATFFLQLKRQMLAADLAKVQRHPATWEKKGKDLITTGNMQKYPHIREGISRLLRELDRRGGKIFWYGRQKYLPPEESNSSGLYTTVLSHAIRQLDSYVQAQQSQFMIILDQHSDRLKLLETAAKTMFSPETPARTLIEPPFQVESHLYQTIQAADWIATLIGRQQAHKLAQEEFHDWEWANQMFGPRISAMATHSKMWTPRTAKVQKVLPINLPKAKRPAAE